MSAKAKPTEADATPDYTACPYWGQGGRFTVIDGKRVPVMDAVDAPADGIKKTPVAGDALTAESSTTVKGPK